MEGLLNYDGLIYKIISKYSNRFDKDDLYQVGMIGLIDAYKHYNSSYGTKFSTFAYYYIVGEVNKYIRENNGIKISKGLIELKQKILKCRDSMTQKLGRIPTNLEIALYLDEDEELINNALIATDEVTSIDEQVNLLKSYDDTSPEVLDLKSEIGKLSINEQKLIYARYYEELTQSETSDILGMSQVQVSRNEAKVLKKLRESL